MGAARSRANRRGRRPRRPAEACTAVLPWVTTRGDSRCRQHPRRGQDPSLRTEPLTGAHANPRAGHARPLPRDAPGTAARVNPTGVFISPIRRAGCPHPAATSRRRQHPGRDESLHYSPCLPPWGKVAPQGRMRGRLPPPPIPGQPVGGGVPDAPETSRQHPSPGQSPANIRPRKPAGRACPAPTG